MDVIWFLRWNIYIFFLLFFVNVESECFILSFIIIIFIYRYSWDICFVLSEIEVSTFYLIYFMFYLKINWKERKKMHSLSLNFLEGFFSWNILLEKCLEAMQMCVQNELIYSTILPKGMCLIDSSGEQNNLYGKIMICVIKNNHICNIFHHCYIHINLFSYHDNDTNK